MRSTKLEITNFRKIIEYRHLSNKEEIFYILKISIKNLQKFLYSHYEVEPLVLINEYDIPIQISYHSGYHKELISFMSYFLGSSLRGRILV